MLFSKQTRFVQRLRKVNHSIRNSKKTLVKSMLKYAMSPLPKLIIPVARTFLEAQEVGKCRCIRGNLE